MYMPTWPAANAWLIVPHSKRKLLPIELSSQRIAWSVSSACDGAGVVDGGRRLGRRCRPASGRRWRSTRAVSIQPPGVVLRHLRVAGLAGGVGDLLGVLADLVPRGRRGVRVEPGLLEHRPVVVQPEAVGGERHAVDLALGVLGDGQHVGVEVGGVRQRLELRR